MAYRHIYSYATDFGAFILQNPTKNFANMLYPTPCLKIFLQHKINTVLGKNDSDF